MTVALSTAVLNLPALPIRADDKRHWAGIRGGAQALSIAEIVQTHPGLVVVITHNSQTAARLEDELRFFLPDATSWPIAHFPDWETLPYDQFSPHQDIISQRLQVLSTLGKLTRGVLVISASTSAHRLAPKDWLLGQAVSLRIGQKLTLDNTRTQLDAAGYRLVDTVYEHGEFAVRGSLIDLYPMGAEHPVRIELFDDEIETLRLFDGETQRTVEAIDQLTLMPAHEFPLDKAGIRRFRDQWADTFSGDPKRCSLYTDVINRIAGNGIEYYLPLFFEQCGSIFDYLPSTTLMVMEANAHEQLGQFRLEVSNRYEQYRGDLSRPLLPPERLFLADNDWFGALSAYPRITLAADDLVDEARAGQHQLRFLPAPLLPIDSKAEQPLAELKRYLSATDTPRVLICAETAGRRESLSELFARHDLNPEPVASWADFLLSDARVCLTVGALEQGILSEQFALVAESQLFGQRVAQRRRRKATSADGQAEMAIRSLSELQTGAPVVHNDHGVGRYQGLVTLDMDGTVQEFLLLEYADSAKLYVPVSQLQVISRYAGADDAMAPLHRLGTEQWTKARRKAAEQVRDTAAELLNLYARRAARQGFSCGFDELEYRRFADGFLFEETADQAAAILSTLADMRSPRPMDRLVCGDVGFGKTEVAMRAAFVAVQAGKQVAVLVPTTLLAQQHVENFRDRFADWPIRIEGLSRFQSAKEQKATMADCEAGLVDIVVGTHKLLQPDMHFKQLGLIIVDEEHRFGVRHKEALKQRRAEVDLLTLTATPIPRTLNMAFSGLRDLSIIATPPARRLAVKTFVRESNEAVIKEAILRELLRGGQCYYLHNEVESIEKTADSLRALVPEARIGVAHGQMRERELEQVMSQFYHKQFNILVCSTIIETGIDVPSANTIIMDRADKLGLAQLHQLRGRVGRSHHQAYAYLLTPPQKSLTGDAEKRLEAIAAAGDLGAGFALASHDLEIRGAGELLGEGQSGDIHSVGFTLYMEMLERAVKAIRSGHTPNLDQPFELAADINLRISALIPDDYLPDVHNRLLMYKRISSADSADALDELQVEMIDRFGLLPEPVKNLFAVSALRLRANASGIRKIDAGPSSGRIDFAPETSIDPRRLITLIQQQPKKYKLEGGDKLRFSEAMSDGASRLRAVNGLLDALTQ
ncbi:transcription-repair coupling factor [Paraperlucidibaca baekdonensis]|uniref:Transcription-repair-coupling factor n=1 Tax=Paraperlucidibaca baekdonensis TaxID=748120 RepID=A0A3E0H6D0_9GAMM|nr:transcription-repair coupling factor [Paraperlucidibaca baekdonensis]REH39040.1 transcription-repair coupling factor [Paraperlucidibaca baekdonensis]